MQDDCTASVVRYKCLGFLGHPSYRVGDDGTFWKLVGGVWCRRKATKEPKYGYRVVSTWDGVVQKMHKLHRLILEAFVGPCPEGMESRHLDGDPDNNKLDNLAWGTKLENHDDRRRHGNTPTGEKNHGAKLTERMVREIRELSTKGLSRNELGRRFGMSRAQISRIVTGVGWRHVK